MGRGKGSGDVSTGASRREREVGGKGQRVVVAAPSATGSTTTTPAAQLNDSEAENEARSAGRTRALLFTISRACRMSPWRPSNSAAHPCHGYSTLHFSYRYGQGKAGYPHKKI